MRMGVESSAVEPGHLEVLFEVARRAERQVAAGLKQENCWREISNQQWFSWPTPLHFLDAAEHTRDQASQPLQTL